MARCNICDRREKKNHPPCKNHRIGLSMESKSTVGDGGVVGVCESYKKYHGRNK